MNNWIFILVLSLSFQNFLIGKNGKTKSDDKHKWSKQAVSFHTLLSASKIHTLKLKDQPKALSELIKKGNDSSIVRFIPQFIDQSKKSIRQEMVERASVSIFNAFGRDATVNFLSNRKEVAAGMIKEIKDAKFLYYGIDGRIFHDLRTPQLIPSKVPRVAG